MKTAIVFLLACAAVPVQSWSPATMMTSSSLGGALRRGGMMGGLRAAPATLRTPRRAAAAGARAGMGGVPASWTAGKGALGRAFSLNTPLRMAAATDAEVGGLEAKIKEQGDKVRSLKEAKADKAEIDAAVAVLKQLKADFEAQAGPIELPTNDSSENLLRIRHSSAHVMAMAVQRLYPKAQVTIGPWIENGFYYDFDMKGEAITDADLKKIKKEMDTIIKKKYPIRHEVVSREEARTRIEALDEPYKLELLDAIPEGEDIRYAKEPC